MARSRISSAATAPAAALHAAVLAIVALALALAPAPPAGAQERVRRNIDDLTPQQLADYRHAIERMKEISRQHPGSKDGYDYFAELHNEFDVGPCEHRSDTFLAWHRAHLLEFESALRRSDPPRTADLTLPYWDWSRLPSGRRYARPFEDPGSVLSCTFSGCLPRFATPICKPGGPSPCDPLPWPRHYLDAEVLTAPGWLGIGPKSFGGVSDGKLECRQRRRTGYGALEQPVHNKMHSTYVGGLMYDDATAAGDPIFWSFHAYIDLLFDAWQQGAGHAVDSCLDCKLCGLVKKDGTPWTVRDTLSTRALDYRYQYVPAAAPPLVTAEAVGGPFAPFPAAGMALSGRLPIELLRTREIVVPKAVAGPVELRLSGVPVPRGFSYDGDVYLHPQDVDFTPRDPDFRDRYMIDLYSIWQSSHAHHEESAETEIVIDLTDELEALAAGYAGQRWNLTLALVANTLGSDDRVAFGAEAVGPDASFAEAMSFDDMDLEGLP